MKVKSKLSLVAISPKPNTKFGIKSFREFSKLQKMQHTNYNVVLATLGINTLPEIALRKYSVARDFEYPLYSFMVGDMSGSLKKFSVVQIEGMEKIFCTPSIKMTINDCILEASKGYPPCIYCHDQPKNLFNHCQACNGLKTAFYDTVMGELFDRVCEDTNPSPSTNLSKEGNKDE